MGKNKALTQEEIWDDSALVQSWDEAVEEYKLYHSIHARGENIEDVLREAEEAERAQADQEQEPPEEVDYMEADEAPVVNPAMNARSPAETKQIPQVGVSQPAVLDKQPKEKVQLGGAAPMPHPALAQVQDEGLKNLMMSWYYAGYYTGLYEGQQRANQNASS